MLFYSQMMSVTKLLKLPLENPQTYLTCRLVENCRTNSRDGRRWFPFSFLTYQQHVTYHTQNTSTTQHGRQTQTDWQQCRRTPRCEAGGALSRQTDALNSCVAANCQTPADPSPRSAVCSCTSVHSILCRIDLICFEVKKILINI